MNNETSSNDTTEVQFRLSPAVRPMLEEIRAARASRLESTANNQIAVDALKLLHSKICGGV